MKTKKYDRAPRKPTLARAVHAEDLAPGDFAAVLNEIVEWPSFFWSDCAATLTPEENVRTQRIPCNAGEPLRIEAICLPFVYAKDARGELRTLDVRQAQLVRLQKRAAKAVWRELQPRRGKSSKKRR